MRAHGKSSAPVDGNGAGGGKALVAVDPLGAAQGLLTGLGRTARDYQWAVFHQPVPKFVRGLAKKLGFTPEQIAPVMQRVPMRQNW